MTKSHDERDAEDEAAHQVALMRRVARVMDDAVEIPGLGIRVGLDPLIGLIPGLGDAAGALINGWIIVSAARMGASRSVLTRMLVNAGIDALVGAVPLLGDLFDFAFRAHRKNLHLLEAHLADPREARLRSRRLLIVASVGATTVLVGGAVALGSLLWMGIRALTS